MIPSQFPSQDALWWIIFFLLLLLLSRLQFIQALLNALALVQEMDSYDKISKWYVTAVVLRARPDLVPREGDIQEIVKRLASSREFRGVLSKISEIADTFMIEPESLDPYGVIYKLEHILKTREEHVERLAEELAPNVSDELRRTLTGALEAHIALHWLNKLVKHLFVVARKTSNIYLIMQLTMLAPFIRQVAKSVFDCVRAHVYQVPIGDSIAPIIARLFWGDKTHIDEETRMEWSETEYHGRKLIVMKALGPGSEVGKPGKALEKLVESLGTRPRCVITVDAALKLEGEPSGSVAVGVGAAIGDVGPQKWRIEETCTRLGIPLYAVVIKQSLPEAYTPLAKELVAAIRRAADAIRTLIEQRTREGDSVILLCIGNTLGVI